MTLRMLQKGVLSGLWPHGTKIKMEPACNSERIFLFLTLVVAFCLPGCLSQRPLEYYLQEEIEATVANIKQDANFTAMYDADTLIRLRFNFRSSATEYSNFEINKYSGLISVKKPIDREEICPYSDTCDITLDISITPVEFFQIVKVIVHIQDINDNAPSFPQDSIQVDISENTRPVTAIYQIPEAEDLDSGINTVQNYILQSTDGSSNIDKFGLRVTDQPDGSKDVRLELNEQLDRETDDFYSMKVIAIDGGNPSHSSSVIINVRVTDANDNNPRFANSTYHVQIMENQPVGTPILTVEAHDPDLGDNGKVIYNFAPHTLTDHGQVFGINNRTGEIYIKGTVDFEQTEVFQLTVTASDMGPNSLTAYAKVMVKVLDVNDEAPIITVNALTETGQAQVIEHAEVNTFVAYISVTDRDSGLNGEFDCVIDSSLFVLEEHSGSDFKILTAAQFDRETTPEFQISMSCTDRGSPPLSNTKRIPVKVIDINDHHPKLSAKNYVVAFKENNTEGAVVVQINATDKDEGANAAVKFYINEMDGSESNTVQIHPVSGVVTAKISFDYEKKNFYKYLIRVEDQGKESYSASATMTLTIQDINDEWPRFPQSLYHFKVAENQAPSTDVGLVNASDADSEAYNAIRYSIVPSKSASVNFEVDAFTGRVFTTQILDREEKDHYMIQVLASNPGYPHINSTANVSIEVTDVNDNAPTITFPKPNNNTVQMPHKVSHGYQVTRIEAKDKDKDKNAMLIYSISSGNEQNTFGINNKTGAIVIENTDAVQEHKTFRLTVSVFDKGDPVQTSFADLSVYVNKSLSAAALTGEQSLLAGNNLIILIGVVCGVVLIIIIITTAVLCVRSHRRHVQKKHNYNCRLQEAKTKSLSNGTLSNDSNNRFSGTSSDSSPDEKSVENGHLGKKTKDKVKKEVTFSLDKDDPSWPLHAEPKVIEATDQLGFTRILQNPHAHSTELESSKGQGRTYPLPVHDGGLGRKPGGGAVVALPPMTKVAPPRSGGAKAAAGAGGPLAAGESSAVVTGPDGVQHHHHHHHHHHHLCSRHSRRPAQSLHPGMMYGSERPLHHLTQGDLEMHDMLNSSVDHESECSCSGSITDSGRGPSEEGDTGLYTTAYPPPPPPVDVYGYPIDPRSIYLEPMPIADTIYEETGELAVDEDQLEPPEDGTVMAAAPPGVVYYSPRGSVDGQGRSAARYRYPQKPPMEQVHRPVNMAALSRCTACRSPLRSSMESINSAPGRMDNQDNLALGASALDPSGKNSPSRTSDESLVSGVARLDGSEETLPKASEAMATAPKLQRHLSDCVHTSPTRQKEVPHRRPAMYPYKKVYGQPMCCHGNSAGYPRMPYNVPAGYAPSKHAKELRVSDQRSPSHSNEHLPSPAFVIKTPPPEFQDPYQKGMRYAAPPSGHDTDCVSDDGTTTSGSYTVDSLDMRHNNNMKTFRLPDHDTEDGTVV